MCAHSHPMQSSSRNRLGTYSKLLPPWESPLALAPLLHGSKVSLSWQGTTWLEKPGLKATSWALEVPHFCGLASAKDTDGEKSLHLQQHAAKVGMAMGKAFTLHWGNASNSCVAGYGGFPKNLMKWGPRVTAFWEPRPQITLW